MFEDLRGRTYQASGAVSHGSESGVNLACLKSEGRRRVEGNEASATYGLGAMERWVGVAPLAHTRCYLSIYVAIS